MTVIPPLWFLYVDDKIQIIDSEVYCMPARMDVAMMMAMKFDAQAGYLFLAPGAFMMTV